jgi:hypothetical protein
MFCNSVDVTIKGQNDAHTFINNVSYLLLFFSITINTTFLHVNSLFLFDFLLFIIILSELIFTSTSFYFILLFRHFQRGYAWLFVIVLASCHFVLHTIFSCIVFFTLYTTIVGDISLKLFNHRYTFRVSFSRFSFWG